MWASLQAVRRRTVLFLWGIVGGFFSIVAVQPAVAIGPQPGASVSASAPAVSAASAATQTPLKLRVIGGLAGLNQFVQHEEPFWAQHLGRLSAGRYSADIFPFDRAGVPGTEMLRLMQLGVVPFGTMLVGTLASQYPQYAAADLPGLGVDLATTRASIAAFRPYLESSLRQQHGVQVLAVYAYPAQVLFCKDKLTRLADLRGRRIRVSSVGQADWVEALGGRPVHTAFAQLPQSLQSGDTQCAITGSLSGHTLGLYEMSAYLYPLPINWGIAVFGANLAVWNALPAALRELLQRELPRLEDSIWKAAEHDTMEGVACNTGAMSCKLPRMGGMKMVHVTAEDEQQSREIFQSVVLTRWLRRCTNIDCAALWNSTVGEKHGIFVPVQRP